MIIEQWVRTALDQQFLDPYGKIDDEAAAEKAWEDRRDAVRLLYSHVKKELISRGFKDDIPHPIDEKDMLEKAYDTEEGFYDLYGWCILKLRKLGIDVPHDKFIKRTVLKASPGGPPIPIGQKILSEKQQDRLTERWEKEGYE